MGGGEAWGRDVGGGLAGVPTNGGDTQCAAAPGQCMVKTKILRQCEGTEGAPPLPVNAVIYASVEQPGARGPMLVEAMTEVEKMDLRLTARGPASAKCESPAPGGSRRLALRFLAQQVHGWRGLWAMRNATLG